MRMIRVEKHFCQIGAVPSLPVRLSFEQHTNMIFSSTWPRLWGMCFEGRQYIA